MASSPAAARTPPAPSRRSGGALGVLPSGDSLPREDWRRRHAWICRLLWTHVVVVPVYGILRGQGVGHALLEGSGLVAVLALAASSRRLDDSLRSLTATLGLVVSSAVLVHFSGGLIEMHFHFFVVVVVVSLYQSWRPFLVALGVVLVHHGVTGMIEPTAVYNHPAALARPWLWALVHAGFVMAESIACLVTWRLNEDALARERRARTELAAAQQVAAVGSWDWDLSTDEVSWSDELHRIFQVDPAVTPTLGTFLRGVHPEDRDWVTSLVEAAPDSSGDLDYECRIVRPDGTTRTIHARGTLVVDHTGSPVSLRGTCQDVTERRALEQEIEYRALYDSLTDLANRSLFMDRLEHALAAHDRTSTPTVVLYLDLDGFKTVNDRHGHHAGDQLLVEAARRLRRCVRDSDTLARLGGDEFAALLPASGLVDARQIADRVQRELAEPLVIDDEPHRIAVSIGIAVVDERQRTASDLLREADTAMYAAKAAGRGGHETYVPGIERATTLTLPGVVPVEALAWADYMRRLRLEIADRKLTGDIAPTTRAPEAVHRTLERVLAAIGQLSEDAATATLVLPPQKDVEEFVFHQTAVQHWADVLIARGNLTTDRTREADRFWRHVEHHTAGRQRSP